MNDLKMGFKQSLLQRLQTLGSGSTPQPHLRSSASPVEQQKRADSDSDSATRSSTNSNNNNNNHNMHITDFSIQRILGAESKEVKQQKAPKRKLPTPQQELVLQEQRMEQIQCQQETPPSSPVLYAPIAKKAKPNVDILDLSKTGKEEHTASCTVPLTEFQYPLPPNLGYSALHPNLLAAVAAANAQKFYAQFFPQIFPTAAFYGNRNVTAAANPLQQKRYFAPYILSPPAGSVAPVTETRSTATAQPLTPTTPNTLHAPHIVVNSASPTSAASSTKYVCSRPDCMDCLDSFYKNANQQTHSIATNHLYNPYNSNHTYPSYKSSPALSPANSSVSSSSSLYYNSKQAKASKELLMNSANISLTAVTNIHLNAAKSYDARGLSSLASASSAGSSINAEEISYKCCICDKVFGCSQTLQAHEKTHKSPRYECTDCGKGFSQLRNYKYHLSVHRGTKEFAAECPECGKTFNDKGYLSSHMKIHRNKKEYECPYCPKSFNQRVAFNMHVRIHTGVKPHKCTECGKRFSRKMLLKQHMRTHSGEKPYQCSVCGKSFADRSNMTLHHRLHSGIKPFNCPICPKAFTKKHHLKTHLNYHTGCKPYVCPHPNCNQAFTQSSNMRTHAKKCQYRPLQMSYPHQVHQTTPPASHHHNSAASGNITTTYSASSIGISRLPSMSSSSIGNLANISSLRDQQNGNNNSSSSNHNSHSGNIPFMPATATTTLSAGIRMLSTVTSSAAAAAAATVPFPPAQQPLLSTLRPF